LCRLEIFRSHNSFGREFVDPREQHRDWKSQCERNDNKTHRIIRNLKKWKDLRRKLREEPRDDSVGDCCAINVASLQLGQKLRWIHSARLDEALVTPAILVGRAGLEKRVKRPKQTLKFPNPHQTMRQVKLAAQDL
jgi:hypothetical protein